MDILIVGFIFMCLKLNCGMFCLCNKLACDFQDSINITNGHLQPDGALVFDGIKYEKDQIATVNYRLINGSNRTQSYLRGCPCNIKPCIRLCCPLGSFFNMSQLKRGTILQQIPCYNHQAAKNFESQVIDQQNHSKVIRLDENFFYVVQNTPIKFYKLKNYQISDVMFIFQLFTVCLINV